MEKCKHCGREIEWDNNFNRWSANSFGRTVGGFYFICDTILDTRDHQPQVKEDKFDSLYLRLK